MSHVSFLSLIVVVQLAGCSDSSFEGSKSGAPSNRTQTKSTPPADGSGDANGAAAENAGSSPDGAGSLTPDVPTDNSLAPIDIACQADQKNKAYPVQYPAIQSSMQQTVPANCRSGIEFNNFHRSLVLDATNPEGSQTFKLEVDVATYKAPDTLRIVAVDGQGVEQVIFSSCRMQTANVPDPSDGKSRPTTDVIRFFRPLLPKGTRQLKIDFDNSNTPSYMKITGLCDFTIPTPNAADARTTTN